MQYIIKLALFIIVLLSVACATTSNQFRSVNYSEAMEFELSLGSVPAMPSRPEVLYIQPLNKNEPCKLPTSKDQLERKNFRAYWDGQCKNGYAYGLGRDIAVSDTHHVEEISIHDGNGDNFNGPSVDYDFVNNTVIYMMGSETFPALSQFAERIQKDFNGFNVMYLTGTIDDSGNSLITRGSPLNPGRELFNDDRRIAYKFTDNTAAPIVDPSAPIFVAQTLDSKSKRPGGFAIVRYGNGQISHFKVKDGQHEPVTLPEEYLATVNRKYNEVTSAYRDASSKIENARRMEREYLHMACSDSYKIDGVDADVSSKICSWRNQFKVPFNDALEKYNAKLEEQKRTAQSIQQQQKYQEQIALQQGIIDEQRSQQDFQNGMNALNDLGKQMQMQNSDMQKQQYFLNQSLPQVAPLSLPGSNQINCVNVGSVTNCRH
ncbi:MAG: hypothetical protein WCS87_17535 [Methylococcaceae bacterium]